MQRVLFGLIAALAATLGQSANAQVSPCTSRPEIISHLAGKYSEAPVAMGIANNGGVVEILTSDNGTTWTIIITMPNGMACLVAAGKSWEKLPHELTGIRPTT